MKKIPKNWSPQLGDVVEITFFDHADGRVTLEFLIFGRIAKINRRYYVIEMWTYANIDPDDFDDDNIDKRSILRSTITRMEWLKGER